jgi:hypothetical protein
LSARRTLGRTSLETLLAQDTKPSPRYGFQPPARNALPTFIANAKPALGNAFKSRFDLTQDFRIRRKPVEIDIALLDTG